MFQAINIITFVCLFNLLESIETEAEVNLGSPLLLLFLYYYQVVLFTEKLSPNIFIIALRLDLILDTRLSDFLQHRH